MFSKMIDVTSCVIAFGNRSNWRNRTQPPSVTPAENLTKAAARPPTVTIHSYHQKEIIEQPTGSFSKGDSKENNTCRWKFANRDFGAVGRSDIEWFRSIIFNIIMEKDMKRSCPTRVELWTAFRILATFLTGIYLPKSFVLRKTDKKIKHKYNQDM